MYEQEFDVLSVEYEPKETDMPGGVKTCIFGNLHVRIVKAGNVMRIYACME